MAVQIRTRDVEKRIVGGSSLLEQARQTLRNVQTAIEAAGGTLRDVLREFFSPENAPASTWIGVSALAVPDFQIEIEATAVLN